MLDRLPGRWAASPGVLIRVVGAALSFYAFQAWRALESADAKADFDMTAGARLGELQRAVVRPMDAVVYVQSLMQADGQIDSTTFQRFVRAVMGNNSEIVQAVWAVAETDRPGFVARYVVPAGAEQLVGRDIATDPAYGECLARTAQLPSGMRRLCLAPQDNGGVELVVILPVTQSDDGRNDKSVVAARLWLGHLVQPAGRIKLEIFDLAAPTVSLLHPDTPGLVTAETVTQAGGFYSDRDFGGTRWRFAEFAAAPQAGSPSWQSLCVLAGCLTMTLNLAGYVLVSLYRRRSIEALVLDRTQELEEALINLQLSEQRLRDYIGTASDWYWETDAEFHFTRVAAQAEEHGIDAATLGGLEKLTEDDSAEMIARRLETLKQHRPFRDLRYDYPGERSLLTISLSGVPLFGDDGAFLGYRGSARDITIQMQAEAAQRSARWAAEQANRAKSTFLATMSHEIRTPMNGVLGMTQVLAQTALDAAQRKMCDVIVQSARGLQQILNDILDYSKLEAGKVELEVVSASLTEIIDDVASLMRSTAEAKGLVLDVQASNTGPARVIVDPTRLRQILFNLLSNAIKFSERGIITVRLLTELTPRGSVDVTLLVADQGIGMTAEVQRRLFTRFSQADASTTRRFGGTGLGLAITRELVTLLGGEIVVASVPGEGTKFTIRLTLPVAEADETPSQPEPRAPRTAEAARGIEILLAEDDRINQLVILGLLRDHRVTIAGNGEEAVRAASTARFDVVLMDVMMPVMDGIAATAAIRALPPPHGKVPIIALTANAMSGDRERYLAAGMNGYASKPIEQDRLFDAMEQVLDVTLLRPQPVECQPTPPPEPAAAAAQDIEDFIGSLDIG